MTVLSTVEFVTCCYVFTILLQMTVLKAVTDDCDERFRFPQWNIEFNICKLKLAQSSDTHQIPSYKVTDTRYNTDPDIEYAYYFNVAASVLDWPSSLCEELTTGYCTQYTSSDNNAICTNSTTISWLTWAYRQKFNKSDAVSPNVPIECKHLTAFKDDHDLQLELYSNSFPPQGIIIDMANGDYDESCAYHQDNHGKNTRFSLILLCADSWQQIPMFSQVFYDPDKCWYWLKQESIFGCPIECDVYGDRLCAGNGICGYDFTNAQAKCQCFYGYGAKSDCSIHDPNEVIPKAAENVLPSHQHSYTFVINDTASPPQTILYELSEFYLNESQFVITSPNEPWRYYLNLSTYLNQNGSNQLPEACKTSNVGKPCKIFAADNSCSTYANISYGQGILFRYNEETQKCELLATDYDVALYDEHEAAKGVTINVHNGSYCGGHSGYNVNRGANIYLICDNGNRTAALQKDIELVVYADDAYDCRFEMWWETGMACPWNCFYSEYSEYNVCNLHGSCMFDPFAGHTICKCDNGWEGTNCQTKSTHHQDKGLSTETILEISIISLLLILCVISIIFCIYFTKLKRKYQKFENKHGQQLLLNSDESNIDTDVGNVAVFGSSGAADADVVHDDDYDMEENEALMADQ